MRPVKRIVKRVIYGFCAALIGFFALWYIGFTHGLTPLPKPPLGVRLEPLAPPLARDDLKPDNGAFSYANADDVLSGYKQSAESSTQMAALLSNDIPADTTAIRQTLADCREALDLCRKGAQMDFCQMPWLAPSTNSLPLLSSLRRLSRMLIAEGKLAQQAGDSDRAITDDLVAVKLGRDCSTGGPLLMSLVGLRITFPHRKSLLPRHSVTSASTQSNCLQPTCLADQILGGTLH